MLNQTDCFPRKIQQHTRLKMILFIVLCGVSLCVWIISTSSFQEYYHDHRYLNMSGKHPSRRPSRHIKRVLFYTTYFGRTIWPHDGVGRSGNLTREDRKPCVYDCLITYNKSDLNRSDAVIFHERDLFSAHILKSISIDRFPQQRWVYFTSENPHNTGHDPSQYNGLFNWTITYKADSDVFYPDGHYQVNQSPSLKHINTTNFAKGKDKLIVWAVSHCGLIRDKVVHNILQFLPVRVIGRCSKLLKQTSPSFCNKKGSETCDPFFRHFKFYLAFENGMCTDYITEKYWKAPFVYDMVPIVLGSNYDAKVAIPGSYINILDFQSIEAFAKYVKYLDLNDTAYNEYFQWKTKFTKIEAGEKSWTCQLCANLYNNSLPKKVYTNLGVYWGVDNNCNKSIDRKIERLING